MKLYFSPGACSLSPHITLREAGLDFEIEKVDTKAKKTASGRDYLTINPKGYVPALELDDGYVLTEGPAIVQYLADLKPEARLAPKSGTKERYQLQEALGYINSEIHKSYTPLFYPTTPQEVKDERQQYLKKRYGIFEKALSGKQYLFGDDFTVADAYLFTVTNWAGHVKLDLADFPNVLAFQKRVAERPSVVAAQAAEKSAK
jgi:glutathione S-transferase